MNTGASALTLPATLDHASAAEFVKGIAVTVRPVGSSGGAQAPTSLVVDASALAAFDSSALAVLLECRRRAIACERAFFVSGASARLMQLAGLYGISDLLPAQAAILPTGALGSTSQTAS